MEPKRGCCMQNYRPVSPQRGLCTVRKCNYNSKQQNDQIANNQKLLHRIQHIKKNLERFQNPNRPREGECRNNQRDGESQTPDFTRSDLNSFRQILNNCIVQMRKLKKFVEDENFWWKVFKDKDFNCCEQNMPHLHGFLDGTMVTLKILEERLGEPVAHSTPERRRSDPLTPCQEHLIGLAYGPREDERARRLEEFVPVEHTRRTSPRTRVSEERQQIDYSPERVPRTPIRSPRMIERSRIDEPVFIEAPRVPIPEQRELQFYSLPEYEESFPRGHTISYQMSNGSRVERPPHQVVEPAISPRIIEQMVEPRNQRIIEERRNNNRYRTSAPPEISIIENGHETFRTSIPTVGTTQLGLWHTRSASECSPSQTFNTENTARKQIILSDISTSVEFHPVQEMSHYPPRQEKRFMIKDNKNNNQCKKQNQCEVMQERKENNEQEIA